MGKLIDRVGHTYGRLKVIKRHAPFVLASNGIRTKWKCKCKCGSVVVITGHELASGDTKSCGCLHDETIGDATRTHGLTKTPTYKSWQAAKERCYNPNNDRYNDYGARGITMCAHWRNSFENFLIDMGLRPIGMTLDRINTNGPYKQGNCRWATSLEQASNKRTNVTWKGEKLTIKEIANRISVPRTSLNKLIRSGMSIEIAIIHAINHRRSTSSF